jgi:hypothetical protein
LRRNPKRKKVNAMKNIPEAIRIRNGHRRYLARLRQLQTERRHLVASAWAEAVKDGETVPRGTWRRLAEKLDCSPATVCRDLAFVRREAATD